MKILDIVHNDISVSYPEIHSTRLATLFTFVSSGMKDQRVSVTYLGRGLKSLSKTTVKNDIKRADRLIGNVHLHSERFCFYTYTCDTSGCRIESLKIIIDPSIETVTNFRHYLFEKVINSLSKLFCCSKIFIISNSFIHHFPKPLYRV